MPCQVRTIPSVVGDTRCKRCGRLVMGVSGLFTPHVAIMPTVTNVDYSGYHAPQLYGHAASGTFSGWPAPVTLDYYCAKCVQVNQSGIFLTREDWIRESLPEWVDLKFAPPNVLADYLTDQNRIADANYMRSLCSD